jgi:hypothetical protein
VAINAAQVQAADQIAADLAPEDVFQPAAGDVLVTGNGRQHGQIKVAQIQRLSPHIRRLYRRGKTCFCAQGTSPPTRVTS